MKHMLILYREQVAVCCHAKYIIVGLYMQPSYHWGVVIWEPHTFFV